MSSSKSLSIVALANLRVAGELDFIPEHINAGGEQVNSRCVIPAYINTGKSSKTDPTNTISHQIKLTVWGKLADSCAKLMHKGKEFSVIAQIRQYKGKVYYTNGQPVNDVAGGILTTQKISFNVMDLSYGDDARAFVASEIAAGRRAVGWDQAGTPAHAAFIARLGQIKAYAFSPEMKTFGFARVLQPNNATQVVTNANANPGTVANNLPAGYTVDNTGNAQVDPNAAAGAAAAGGSPFPF